MSTETPNDAPVFNTGFVTVINDNGTLNTFLLKEGEPFTIQVARTATTYDVYSASKTTAEDIEQQLLADRVARTVLANLQPKDAATEIKEKIINALSDRGIDTPLN